MAAPRQQATPSGGSTTHFKVTPENVVDLATTFSQVADLLEPIIEGLDRSLILDKPWLGDPVSEWAQHEFNTYFVHGNNSLLNMLNQAHRQHLSTFTALKKIAEQYGKTEELNQNLIKDQGPDS